MSATPPTTSDFHARFDGDPIFVGVSDATIAVYMTEALDFVSPAVWGKWFSQGTLLFSAHNLAAFRIANAKGGAGSAALEVDSKSVGGVSVGRAGALSRAGANRFQSTKYGQQYYELLKQVATPVLAAC
jgi:hypothetical protein